MPTFRPFGGRAKRGPTVAPVAPAVAAPEAAPLRASEACPPPPSPHSFEKGRSQNNSIVSATGQGVESGTRPSFASVARLRVDTGNSQGSSTLRMRATAVQHKETYERGMSPALSRARSVYLDSTAVSPPSGRRTSSGLAVEITDTAEENVAAKVRVMTTPDRAARRSDAQRFSTASKRRRPNPPKGKAHAYPKVRLDRLDPNRFILIKNLKRHPAWDF